MISDNQKKFSIPQLGAAVVILLSIITLCWFVKWLIYDAKDDDKRINGISLAIAVGGVVSVGVQKFYQYEIQLISKQVEESTERRVRSEIQTESQTISAINLVVEVINTIEASGLQENEIENHINQIEVNSLLNLEQQDAISLKEKIREFKEDSDARQEAVKCLSHDDDQLKALAKEAGDFALKKHSLESLGMSDYEREESKYPLYGDIYLYLKTWLSSSLKYNQSMPLQVIRRAIPDRRPYIVALSFIKNERINYFSLSSEASKKVVIKFLDALIQQLS